VISSPETFVQISELFGKVQLMSSKLMVAPFLGNNEFVGFGTYHKKTGELDPETGMTIGGPVSPFYVTVAQAADVAVNVETGQVKVRKIAAAMDVGKAVNPQMVKYQIFGSVMMGLSETLGEELRLSDGRVTNTGLADYKILTALDTPEIETIILETPYEAGPFGAKSAGEPSILPTAPAVRNAIHDAVGIWIDDLPITAEKVLQRIGKN
jgi:nicotinate dehydrogenase medium molybdopterin subunit